MQWVTKKFSNVLDPGPFSELPNALSSISSHLTFSLTQRECKMEEALSIFLQEGSHSRNEKFSFSFTLKFACNYVLV